MEMQRSNKLLLYLYEKWRLLSNEGRPLEIEWNIMHMFSSSQLAKLYAIKYDLDPELSSIIAILHDIAVVEGKVRENHDILAKEYITNLVFDFNILYLGQYEITPAEIKTIIEAVTVHSQKDIFSSNPYVEMIKDVDGLDRYLYGIKTEAAYKMRVYKILKDIK